jgi:hypothetical protein
MRKDVIYVNDVIYARHPGGAAAGVDERHL